MSAKANSIILFSVLFFILISRKLLRFFYVLLLLAIIHNSLLLLKIQIIFTCLFGLCVCVCAKAQAWMPNSVLELVLFHINFGINLLYKMGLLSRSPL